MPVLYRRAFLLGPIGPGVFIVYCYDPLPLIPLNQHHYHMKLALAAITAGLFVACKTPTYHYVPTMVNAVPYAGGGEGQLGIAFGSVGMAAKGGISLSPNINLNGFAGGMPNSGNGYKSLESEFSLGVQTNPGNEVVGCFYVGFGTGKNEKEKIGLSGHYNRPFFQAQIASVDKPVFNTSARADGFMGVRINYLDYNGMLNGNNFDDYLVYYEPYFGGAIGGKNVRLEIVQGFSMKNSGDWRQGVRIFPYFGTVGLIVKIRKDKDNKSSARL